MLYGSKRDILDIIPKFLAIINDIVLATYSTIIITINKMAILKNVLRYLDCFTIGNYIERNIEQLKVTDR